jgi:lipopolysaccharide exporter
VLINSSSFGQQVFGGAMWMFAVRWVMRLLSVINIAILARLLDKQDFGLVALASTVIALPAVLVDLGVEQAIISERAPSRGYYNTAWTIRAIQLGAAAFFIYLAGPWIARFYGDPRIAPMVQVLSTMVLLKGIENIWTVSFRKELNFRRDFVYETSSKALALVFTVTLAVLWRSYWALVYGQVAAAAIRVVISVFITSERPKPTLSHWRQLWSYSQWSLTKGAATYIVQNGDRIILARFVGAGAVGAYAMGREIADMPMSEIAMPANRALGPGLAVLQDNPGRLVLSLTKSLAAVATVAFPIGIGLAISAEQVIPVSLGSGWEEAIPVLQFLALASVITALRGVMGNTLAVIGHIKSSAIVMWVRGLLLVAVGIPGAILAGAVGMAVAFLVSETLTTGATVFFYRAHLPAFSFRRLGHALLRPGSSTLIMLACVIAISQSVVASDAFVLMSKVVIGSIAYGSALYFFWRRSGYPDGLERLVFERLGLIRQPA